MSQEKFYWVVVIPELIVSIPIAIVLDHHIEKRKGEAEVKARRDAYEKDKQLLVTEPEKWYDTGSRVISEEKRDLQLDYEPSNDTYPSPRAYNYY